MKLSSKSMLRVLALSSLVLLIALAAASFALAQGDGVKPIGLVTGEVIPDVVKPADVTVSPDAVFDGQYFKLIQFSAIPGEVERKSWENAGLWLVDYLPEDTYFAVIDQGFDLNRLTRQALTIIDVANVFRLEPRLVALMADGQPVERLVVSYYATLDAGKVIADLKSRGVTIEAQRDYSRQLDILIDPASLEEIIALPYLQFLGPEWEEPMLEGYDHRNASGRSNYLNTGYNGLNYNGTGVVVAVGEGGTVDNLVDVQGRLTELVAGAPSSHKITVMQNSGGAGNLDPTNRNNAWGASFLSLESYPDYAAYYNSSALRYTNHSYGIGTTPSGGYDSTARDHDLRIAAYPNHLVVYSAGNSGTDTGYAPYAFANWANITGAMKMNKNMFAIGALLPDDGLMYFSSRGPMLDGRIIPQLVIEGAEGTSDAAPKVTGEVAQLAQVYKAENSGAEPPSSLLRAIMLNTADDLGNAGPDFKYGYGRPNLRRAYHAIDGVQYLTDSVANGNTNSYTIAVPANTRQVRVMIVWPDVAASLNANPAIVNNLNLLVKDPSNTPYNPWVLDSSTPSSPAQLDTPATRDVDSLNTIEQVTVDNPAAGNWTIEVSGANVPSGPQTYYVTYEFLGDELNMMFPLKDQRFVPGTVYHLKWDSYGASGTFSLAYQLDGASWVSIVSGYDATSRTYQWTAPAVTGIHTIKFRVQRGALTSESDVNYIGAVPENFRIFSVCSDEVILKWSAVAGAASYKVYRLGTEYMEEVTSNITFNGASATLTGQSTGSSEYYAVSALTGSYEGQRTMAVEKAPGDYSCGGINWTGAVSTDWFTAGNWSSNSVPTSADSVIIPSAPTNQPIIGAAGAVCNKITIDSGASLTMDGATAYTLSVAGDWTNNGTFSYGIGTVNFNGTNSYQEITGSSTTDFYVLRVEKGDVNRILDAVSPITLNAATPDARLELVSGTFKLSNSASDIIAINNNGTAAANALGSGKRVWVTAGTLRVNSSWRINVGELRITGGTVRVGNANSQLLDYLNNGKLIIQGGQLRVSAGIFGNATTSSCNVEITGGTITVGVYFNGFARPSFEITPNCTFYMSGGVIAVRRRGLTIADNDYLNLSGNATVTGGALQIGDTETLAGQTIRVNSTAPIYNLVVNATNSPTAQLVTNGLTVKNDVTISGGTLNANNLDMAVGGNWTNNGAFTAGTGTVTFNGAAPQTIGGSATNSFNNLAISSGASVTGPSGNMNVAGNWTNNGAYTHNGGTVTFNGAAAQTLGGTASTTFNNLTLNHSGSGVSLGQNQTVNRLLTLTNGDLDLGGNTLTLATTTAGNGVAATGARTVTGNGTVAFTAARTISGGTLAFGPNVTVSLTDGVDFDAGGLSTVNGTLLINGGGYVQSGKAPTYGSSSTLKYDNGGSYTAGEEWYPNTTSGPGVPQNVEIASGTTLAFGSSAFARTARGNVTINGTLALSTAGGGDLNVGGNWINNGAFNHNSRAVTFNGAAAQTIGGSVDTTFAYLTINNTSADSDGVSLGRNTAVNNTLTLTDGLLKVAAYNLTLGTGAGITHPGSTVSMVVTDEDGLATGDGFLCKAYSGNGSFGFPVGDAYGTTEYSPSTLDFTADLDASTVCVRVTDDRHPNWPGANYPTYITRYWTTTSSDNTFTCSTSFTYVDDDVVLGGTPVQTEAALYHKVWDGSSWLTKNQTDVNTNTLSSVVNSFSDHSAFSGSPLAVTLAEFSAAQHSDHILVTWETASELNNSGFNLRRGTSPAGPDRQLNAALIPSQSPGSSGGFNYTWVDDADLIPGTTYYYWLEALDVYGVTTTHGPVSAEFSAPTAVTLTEIDTQGARLPVNPWWAAVISVLLLAGAGFWRRRQARVI